MSNGLTNGVFKPLFYRGTVIRGFGRGSKKLGIPTANFPDSVVKSLPPELNCGVYYGCARVDSGKVHKMVMSIGWNPHFNNTKKTMETHILHQFDEDFYGADLQICITGYIRPEKKFKSLDELISEIKNDISLADSLMSNEMFTVHSSALREHFND